MEVGLPVCGGLERGFRRNAEASLYAWSHGDPFDREQQRRLYIDHNEKVRRLVPKERLLELDVKLEGTGKSRVISQEKRSPGSHIRMEAEGMGVKLLWQ